jgi:hypothetical protein
MCTGMPSSLSVSELVTVVKLVEKRLFNFTCILGPIHSPCIAIIWSCSQPCSLVLLSLLPVWFEPTDTRKAGKVFQSWHRTSLGYVSPNLNELQVISLASGKVWYLYVKFSFQIELNVIPLRHNLRYRDNHNAVKIQSILHCE